jgi:hypothetical protein
LSLRLFPSHDQTRKAIKNRLDTKNSKKDRKLFMASVRISGWERAASSNTGTGAYYGLITASRQGYMAKAAKQAEGKVRKILGEKLASKIAKEAQKNL